MNRQGDYTYAIALPTTETLTSGSNTMTVNTFTSTATTGTLSTGVPVIVNYN